MNTVPPGSVEVVVGALGGVDVVVGVEDSRPVEWMVGGGTRCAEGMVGGDTRCVEGVVDVVVRRVEGKVGSEPIEYRE